MATRKYGKANEALGNGDIDLIADTLKAVLVDTQVYVASLDVDEFLGDIPSGAQLATSAALTSKTNVLGVFDAADTLFAAVPQVASEQVGAVVLYQDTGVSTTSRLIAHIDNAPQLPVPPNGSDITVIWDSDVNVKIFKI